MDPSYNMGHRKVSSLNQPTHVTWCPTVFLCSLLAALITGLAERTLILDVPFPTEVADAASFSSWNKSATIWY